MRGISKHSIFSFAVLFALICFGQSAHAEVGEILAGAATVVAAAAGPIAAGIYANADVKITEDNDQTQIKETKIASDVTKYGLDAQKEVALDSFATTERVGELQQDGATKRLGMQLDELRDAREEGYALEKEKIAYAEKMDNERIALEKQEADQTMKLAEAQFRAQLAAAGLTQGFASTINSAPLSWNQMGRGVGGGMPGGVPLIPINSAAGLAFQAPIINGAFSGVFGPGQAGVVSLLNGGAWGRLPLVYPPQSFFGSMFRPAPPPFWGNPGFSLASRLRGRGIYGESPIYRGMYGGMYGGMRPALMGQMPLVMGSSAGSLLSVQTAPLVYAPAPYAANYFVPPPRLFGVVPSNPPNRRGPQSEDASNYAPPGGGHHRRASGSE